ncbi:MAG: hypothetical protein ACYTBR_04345, partial [Planctomycetota bacterium]
MNSRRIVNLVVLGVAVAVLASAGQAITIYVDDDISCTGCCIAHDAPGCDDPTCEALVCGVDPSCCDTSWDQACAASAGELCEALCGCTPIPPCGDPGAGNCCASNASPGCDNCDCCNLICTLDLFCCEIQWDWACANEARLFCQICGGVAGSADDPLCSIQDAIDVAVDGDEIVVAPGTYHEAIDLLGKAVAVRSSNGPDVTTIDGSNHVGFSVVRCDNGAGPGTIIEGFTITGGSALGGGGMYNNLS